MKDIPQLDLAFSNQIDQSFFPVDFKDISSFLAKIISYYKNEVSFLNYLFTGDDHIRTVNKEHLNHDYPTDIITFQYKKDPIEADIILSLESIQENAKRFNTLFNEELYRVISHGFLHCLGYNDQEDEEKALMREQEEFCLSLHDVSRETKKL